MTECGCEGESGENGGAISEPAMALMFNVLDGADSLQFNPQSRHTQFREMQMQKHRAAERDRLSRIEKEKEQKRSIRSEKKCKVPRPYDNEGLRKRSDKKFRSTLLAPRFWKALPAAQFQNDKHEVRQTDFPSLQVSPIHLSVRRES